MKQHFVITLGRKYGAGGAALAGILSERLGIPYYDKEILAKVSDESGIKESYFHMADEKAGEKMLYKIMKSMSPKIGAPSVGSNLLTDDNLFLFQSQVIKQLAKEGSCIIVGRCADYVLKEEENLARIFLNSSWDARMERMKERLHMDNEKEVEKIIKKTDKQRNDYYNYYTGKIWADVANYDLVLDSSYLGLENCATLIETFLKLKGWIE